MTISQTARLHRSPLANSLDLCNGDHLVQFYEDDSFLACTVADFSVPALLAGEGVVLITTENHSLEISIEMKKRLPRMEEYLSSGQLVMLDAQDTLNKFMVNGSPDPDKFKPLIGGTISHMLSKFPRVKAFGEMVDLLWRENNLHGTIALEKLWTELSTSLDFTLLCAYSMENFNEEKDGMAFHQICHSHTHVIPSEQVMQIKNADEQLRIIAMLQQQSRALHKQTQDLEAEIQKKNEAEKALQHTLHLRDEFLSIAAHEMKTPLTSLRLQIQILQKNLGGEFNPALLDKVRSSVDRSDYQAKRLTNLIDQLLDLARIRLGKLKLEFAPMELCEVTDKVFSNLKQETIMGDNKWFEKNSITFSYDGPVLGNWDKTRIKQIISNLLTNAVKYGDNQPINVHITSTDKEAIIAIQDHGIGIDKDLQHKIFQRFERATNPNYYAGMGLGLYIVRELVEAHHGSVTVKSILGEGSLFKVTLPLDRFSGLS